MPTLVSVVIPAYNAETKIESTLRSVIAQDYPDIEIVVVDDRSTDATAAIAEQVLSTSGRRYKVIHREQNGGECASRNTGTDAAKGDLIWYIDSDDLAESDLVSSLADLISKYDAEISFCGYKVSDEIKNSTEHHLGPNVPNIQPSDLVRMRLLKKVDPSVCCMMIKREFFTRIGLRFTEGCIAGGDVEFQLKAFASATRVASTSECLYIYVHHAQMGSVRDNDTRAKKLARYRSNSDAMERAARYILDRSPTDEVRELIENMILPEVTIRRLTVFARERNKAEFLALARADDTRASLRRAMSNLFRKPELFFKAIAAYYFPEIFFRARSR